MPTWLPAVSWIALGIGFACAAWLAIEQFHHRQHAWIMYLVWPITALYMGPIALWAYYRMGLVHHKPFWQSVFVDTTHCGAGCSLGDIWGEFLLFYTGLVIIGGVFTSELAVDYVLAYLLGIFFQYYSIAPMRGIHGFKGIKAAVKADTLALTAFEVGLFGWMAVFQFLLIPGVRPNEPAYWFMMQVGMCLGFVTSYPMNWWLVRRGWKDPM